MIDSICQWLREGGDNAAADLLQECEMNSDFVDTYFEMSGDRSFDLFDVSISAPRKVLLALGADAALSKQIESAVIGKAESDGVYTRHIRWIPRMTTTTDRKDQELDGFLSAFDVEHVTRFWKKCLARKVKDADGAITAARSMLESVCKHVLELSGKQLESDASLPSLFSATLDAIKMAPGLQTDRALRQVMGNVQSIVSCLAWVRNDIGDAHGKKGGDQIASPLMAELVVNLSVSVALFVLGQHDRADSSEQTANGN